MAGYNRTSLALAEERAKQDCFSDVEEYLLENDGYWKNQDIWTLSSGKFTERGIDTKGIKTDVIADFSSVPDGTLKTELKYHALWSFSMHTISLTTYILNYKSAVRDLGKILRQRDGVKSVTDVVLTEDDKINEGWSDFHRRMIECIIVRLKALMTDIYDIREETERDTWRALRIPGTRLSAVQKREKRALCFTELPNYYKEPVKRYFRRLVIKRSWSHCLEMLRYIKVFFRLFYDNGYADGFLKNINRLDMECYLEWVAEEYEGENATYVSKAVSFIREFLDYIQMAEYPEAPEMDIYRLLYDDDIPNRERSSDTLEKIRYIPEPIRIQLDANVSAIEPKEMRPLYVLLRETGWRGTDILNLRYDNCLEYIWNKVEGKYIPYLCGEITKTGIPVLKIPIRDDVAAMLEDLRKEASAKSTDLNNPDKYLFNTYTGVNTGLPYSKLAFTRAVQDMISRKGIVDADGNLYHFKTHSLRHTRASEYADQGMPIGVIQQMLGHCSLQMSIHYAKTSENVLYKKWMETKPLGILRLAYNPLQKEEGTPPSSEVCYERVRKELDAVKVPFGVCFKPVKLACKTQLKHCLDCASFCSTREHEAEYREEIKRVEAQVALGERLGRQEWVDKNKEYLDLLTRMMERIHQEGIVHKNGNLREDPHV